MSSDDLVAWPNPKTLTNMWVVAWGVGCCQPKLAG